MKNTVKDEEFLDTFQRVSTKCCDTLQMPSLFHVLFVVVAIVSNIVGCV
jgi:hypothetical protein